MKGKRLLISILAFASLSAWAGEDMQADKSDGCGLGWQVTDKKSLFATSTRGTTNNFVPQSFGITTGTMDCEQHSIVKNDKMPLYYTESNLDNLLAEMSIGEGEYLSAYATVLNCSNLGAFKKGLQSHYQMIIGGEVNANNVLNNVKKVIKSEQLNCGA